MTKICYINGVMSNTSKSFIGKILFVIGVIIILILLASLIIRFVPKIFGGIANIGSSLGGAFGQKEEIIVTASDVNLNNGERFIVSWDSDIDKVGVYNVSFGCVDNVNIDIETTSGVRRLICENPFTLGQNPGSVTLIANLNKENSFADVPIKISFTQGSKAALASSEVLVTIQNGNPNAGTFGTTGSTITAEPVEQEPKPTNTTTSSQTTSTRTTTSQPRTVVYQPIATGPADLAISNIAAIGNNRIAFTVSNNGGRASGNWYFNYATPTSPKETITSPIQMSLGPNQSMLYTITFNAKASGNQSVTVQIDPNNLISEASETNNIGTITLSGSAFGGGSSNNNDDSYNSREDADFEIRDLQVGRLSGNRFIEDDEAEEGDDIAIRFVVKNRGGEETEDWRFEVTGLPYRTSDDFTSKEYRYLKPGESLEVTVEFENIYRGDYEIEVFVDSENDTREERENNNRRSVDLEVVR